MSDRHTVPHTVAENSDAAPSEVTRYAAPDAPCASRTHNLLIKSQISGPETLAVGPCFGMVSGAVESLSGALVTATPHDEPDNTRCPTCSYRRLPSGVCPVCAGVCPWARR